MVGGHPSLFRSLFLRGLGRHEQQQPSSDPKSKSQQELSLLNRLSHIAVDTDMSSSQSPSSSRTPASTPASASAPASSRSDGGEEETPSLPVSRACEKCTRSKRKCDKTSPVCGRCKRLGTRCNYNYDLASRGSSFESIRPRDHPRFIREGGTIASLLAAVDSFGEPHSPTFPQLLAASRINWRETVDVPFPAIHRWFSIFPRAKIETIFFGGAANDAYKSPFEQLRVPSADVALLLVCVCLISQYVGPHRAGRQIDYPLYRGAKRTFALLKCLMQPTVELMQCGALLCLVEYGHGVVVTAHETLGETMAMARVFDLRPGKYVEEDASRSWSLEEEETCTLWWCLFELEQLIHQDPATKLLPFIVPAPEPDDLLPPDVESDDPPHSRPLPLRLPQSASVRITVENRRRSAQSAVVLHRALLWESRYSYRDSQGIVHPRTTLAASPAFSEMDLDIDLDNNNNNIDPSLRNTPAFNIDDTRSAEQDSLDDSTRALVAAMVNQTDKWELFCDCFSMCLSALFILYMPSLPAIEERLRYIPASQLADILMSPSPTSALPPSPFPASDIQALAAVNFAARFLSDFAQAFNESVKTDQSRLAETVVAPAIQTIGISLEVFLRLGDVFTDAAERFASVWQAACHYTMRWGSGDVVLDRVRNVRRRRGGIVVPPLSNLGVGDTPGNKWSGADARKSFERR